MSGADVNLISVSDAEEILRKLADGFSDALTGAAAEIRDHPATWTSAQVADLLTTLAATTSSTVEVTFPDA